MWVLFWMLDDETDHFRICDDQIEAETRLDHLINTTSDLSCAGIGPITNSTEHWHWADD